jgi:hypothetical protein
MGENTASHSSPPEGVVSTSALAEQKTNGERRGCVVQSYVLTRKKDGVAVVTVVEVVVVGSSSNSSNIGW